MRRTTLALIAVATVLACGVAARQKTRPDVDLQAAIRTETVDGDLKGAIEQYRKLTTSSDRVLAAQAWLRMGQCYEKLGSAEARQAYEHAVRDFADQTAVVTTAQARLLALAGNRAGLAYRQLWTGPKVDTDGRVSPDGRYLSYVDWETGDLALHDSTTGRDRRLTNKGEWDKSAEFGEESAFSPDGRQLAYSWFNGNDRYELRVASIPESGFVKPKRLFDSEDVAWIGVGDWSPDGKSIAVNLQRKDRTTRVGVIPVQSGALHVLSSDGADDRMFFSPDGKWLAVAHRVPGRAAGDLDVFLLAVDGSGESPATSSPGEDRVMGWSPDGKRLLFSSDRTGSMALWSIGIANGKPQGAAVLVRPDIASDSLGITAAGALYVGARISGRDIQVASLDFSTGRVLSPPERPIETFVGSNAQPDWSPDGKYLAYRSVHNQAASDQVLVIRTVDAAESRELRPNLRGFNWPRWAPDGGSFVSQGTDAQGHQGIFRIDAQSGQATPVVLAAEGTLFQRPQWSPDGKRIFYVAVRQGSKDTVVIERDLASGTERDVVHRPGMGNAELSSDGRFLAAFSSTPTSASPGSPAVIALIPTAGGEARQLIQVTRPTWLLVETAWTSDSRAVLVQKLFDSGNRRELWLIPVDGSEPRKLDLPLDRNTNSMRVHPDGRRVAYVAGENKFEIMVLENFLPAVGTTVK